MPKHIAYFIQRPFLQISKLKWAKIIKFHFIANLISGIFWICEYLTHSYAWTPKKKRDKSQSMDCGNLTIKYGAQLSDSLLDSFWADTGFPNPACKIIHHLASLVFKIKIRHLWVSDFVPLFYTTKEKNQEKYHSIYH